MLISLVFYIVSQKNKQRHFRTFFIPGPKDKMATNGKINTNPSGSSHGEQLVAKRLTLMDSNTLGSVWIIGTHNFSLSLEYQPSYLTTQSSITCLLEAIPSFLVAAKSPTASGPYSVLY